MYMRISTPEDYTDNVFGEIMMINLTSKWYDAALVLFKDHAFAIFKKPDIPDEYHIIASSYIKDEDNYINFNRKEQISKDIECYKNIGYELMKMCREYYPEYRNCNFPVSEWDIRFVDDLENFACSQNR